MLQKLVKYSTFNSYLFKDHHSLCRFVFGQRISERVGSIRSSYRITLRIQIDKPEPEKKKKKKKKKNCRNHHILVCAKILSEILIHALL